MSSAASVPRLTNYDTVEKGFVLPRTRNFDEEGRILSSTENIPVQRIGKHRAVQDDGSASVKRNGDEGSGEKENEKRIHTPRPGRHSSENNTKARGNEQKEDGGMPSKTASIRDRISCMTWTWFTLTMATGGIANVLYSIPYRSEWLEIIGVVIMLLNILFFIIIIILITLRFKWNPGSFTHSLTNQSESLFVPTCIISTGTILTNIAHYGIPKAGPWLHTTMQILFWLYASVSVIASSGMYLILWSTQSFLVHNMTPIWTFPAYPLLLVAPIASSLISSLPSVALAARIDAAAIAFGAVCIQGVGFLLSLMIYSAFIYRLMTEKLPRETSRPGMFVSVGPSGFTVTGLVGLGSAASKIMPNGYMGDVQGPFILKLMANITGLWLWGLCLWFFVVSFGANWQLVKWKHPEYRVRFDMTWNSFVFPNTALITATMQIGNAFDSAAIQIFGTVIAVLLVGVWLAVLFEMGRALVRGRLLWPDGGGG